MIFFWKRKNKSRFSKLGFQEMLAKRSTEQAPKPSNGAGQSSGPAAAASPANATQAAVSPTPVKPTLREAAPPPASARQADNIIKRQCPALSYPSGHEQRVYGRAPVSLGAVCEGTSGRYSARISDISIGGCYVDTIGGAAIGEAINSKIQTPAGRWVELHGLVIHHQPHMGFGLRFTHESEKELLLIQQLMAQLGKAS